MSTGYHDERRVMAVEFHGGGWILRAVLEGDLPATESAAASDALAGYMERNRARYYPA